MRPAPVPRRAGDQVQDRAGDGLDPIRRTRIASITMRNTASADDEDDQGVRLTRVDGQRQRHREEDHVTAPVLAPDDQDGAGEQPAGPRHDRGDRPSEDGHERPTELEHGGRHGRAEHAEAHDPASTYMPVPAITRVISTCTVKSKRTGNR